jgi:Signal transduction histidine kinase
MRVTVPPRELAATITARAVLRAGWAVAIGYLAIAAVMLIDLGVSRGDPGAMLPSLGALIIVFCALLAVMLRPGPRRGVLFLAVGTIAAFAFAYYLLLSDPTLGEHGTYLLNRVGVVLLLIGPISSRLIDGMLWCTAGYLLGLAATACAQLALGLEVRPGWGPLVSLVIYLTIILTFTFIRRSQRRFVPDFSAVEVEAARMSGRRELEERAVAIIHDTVLSDLNALANGRGPLDDRARTRFARDIAAVTAATVGTSSALRAGGTDDTLRDGLLGVINDFQWRGLSVEVSGGEALTVPLPDAVGDAVIGALRSCLENVVRHSGSHSAEVFFDSSEAQLSIMVVDHGRGFDPSAIREDRLGIRSSVIARIESCGGSVRLWSAVGAGTSIVMTVPAGADVD